MYPTPSFLIIKRNKLPPFAMYAALPHADYYGGSVALPNIQRHLSWQSLEICRPCGHFA